VCGRFSLATPGEDLADAFGLESAPQLAPRYNIAPTQPILAVRRAETKDGREPVVLRWGFVPSAGRRLPRPLINARAETAPDRPAFREAFESRRCLIPADGFFEWRELPGARARQPYFVRRPDGRPFALAGLWEPRVDTDLEAEGTCTILTTEPNRTVARLHDRMPVILAPEEYRAWLQPADDQDALRRLLRPCPDELLTAYPVGPWVNDARNDVPSCVAPLRA
jgi:putative SOS response-associated peptidase YedK